MSITLYGLCGADMTRHFSPHVWKTVMALKHKGLDFEFKLVPFTGIAEIENGFSKTVPLLKDGDTLVRDSFAIALYLERTYPDAPSLFSGSGGEGMARLVEGYSQNIIHPAISRIVLPDIYQMLAPADRVYFRRTREARLGQTIEEIASRRFGEVVPFSDSLEPIRHTLKFQPWLGGETPLFSDYIVFGALQWARITSTVPMLFENDAVKDWLERCLDLYDGIGRSVPAAI